MPVGLLSENFYYDKSNNEFFSTVFIDQFLLDENLEIAKDITTTYTDSQKSTLVDRLRRIELQDENIIYIARVPLEERKKIMQQFVDSLTNSTLIQILQKRIQNQDYRTKFDFYFGDEADYVTKQKWEEHKQSFLNQEVDNFLNLYSINIASATLWQAESNVSMIFDLNKKEI